MRDSKEKRREQALDLFIDEALDVAENRMNITEPNEHIDFSEKHQADMERIFRQAEKKQTARTIRTFATRAACVLLVCSLVAGGAIVGVDAWRQRFLKFMMDPSQKNTSFSFEEEGGTSYVDQNIELRYVPNGFVKTGNDETSGTVIFEKDNAYFQVSFGFPAEYYDMDAESDASELITINGNEGKYISNSQFNTVVWRMQENNYKVLGNIPKDELIKIAENFIKK